MSCSKTAGILVAEILFGALTSRSVIGCENSERQLLWVILILCAHFQVNDVGHVGAQFNVLVHGFDVWCTDRDDLVILVFHDAAEMVF
jgi:hypothetical protein